MRPLWPGALAAAALVLGVNFAPVVDGREPQVGQCFALDLDVASRWLGSRTWEPTEAELASLGITKSSLYSRQDEEQRVWTYKLRAAGPWTILVGQRVQGGERQECVLAVMRRVSRP